MNYYPNSYYIENPIPTRLFLEEQRWYDRIISDIPVIGYDARLTRRVEDIFMLRNKSSTNQKKTYNLQMNILFSIIKKYKKYYYFLPFENDNLLTIVNGVPLDDFFSDLAMKYTHKKYLDGLFIDFPNNYEDLTIRETVNYYLKVTSDV